MPEGTFTRATGTWTPNSLAGSFAFCCEAGQYYAGTWLGIIGNGERVLTFDTDMPQGTTAVRVSPWEPISNIYSCDYGTNGGNGRFWGGCLDTKRRQLWPAPNGSDVFVRFDLEQRQVTGVYPHGYTLEDLNIAPYPYFDSLFFWSFYDAVRDKIIPIPGTCPDIVVIDPEDQTFTKYPHGQQYLDPENPNPNGLFGYGFMTATELWLVPYASNSFVIFNLDTHSIDRFFLPPGYRQHAIHGGVFDGTYWYSPSDEGFIIRLDVRNRQTAKIMNPYYALESWDPSSPDQQAALYTGGCIKNGKAVFCPDYGPILELNLADNKLASMTLSGMAEYSNYPVGSVGQWVSVKEALGWLWFFGLNNPVISAFDPEERTLYTFPHGKGQGAWCDAAWDDYTQSFWIYPCVYPYVGQVIPDLDAIRRGVGMGVV